MILTKTLKIKVNPVLDRTYYKLGYYDKEKTNGTVEITINIKDLNKSSKENIKVVCDICGKEKKITYYKYLQNIKKYKVYSCSQKCSAFKNKLTKKEKYGDENYNNRIKAKNTCIKKYGVENVQQDKKIKEKTNKTNFKKYGGNAPNFSKEVQEKHKNTTFKNNGINFYNEWRQNIKIVLKEKYNDENYNNREKNRQTNLERYGTENPMQNDKIKNKARKSKLENGSYYTDEQRSNYMNYWLGVKRETNKNKKQLFENWDGIDFYDGENIKNNFTYDSGDKKYPTIDHKISVFYGFKNNISTVEIGKIENLCITKRGINSSKNKKTQIEFESLLSKRSDLNRIS